MCSRCHLWTWCCLSGRVWMCRWMWHKLMISSLKAEGGIADIQQDHVSILLIFYLQINYLVFFAWFSIIIHLPCCICSTYSVIAAIPFTLIDIKCWSWM